MQSSFFTTPKIPDIRVPFRLEGGLHSPTGQGLSTGEYKRISKVVEQPPSLWKSLQNKRGRQKVPTPFVLWALPGAGSRCPLAGTSSSEGPPSGGPENIEGRRIAACRRRSNLEMRTKQRPTLRLGVVLWALPDSNGGPPGYEPEALTAELRARIFNSCKIDPRWGVQGGEQDLSPALASDGFTPREQ